MDYAGRLDDRCLYAVSYTHLTRGSIEANPVFLRPLPSVRKPRPGSDVYKRQEDDRDYQGCMAINVGDQNLAHNITFEDIRVEHIQDCLLYTSLAISSRRRLV